MSYSKDELWFGYTRHILSLITEGSGSCCDRKVHGSLTSLTDILLLLSAFPLG